MIPLEPIGEIKTLSNVGLMHSIQSKSRTVTKCELNSLTFNQMNSDIQFTIETDEKQIPFLDAMILKDDTSLNTDIFYKQTDTH